MDITKQNFASILAKFEELLARSEFVAIDEEMTGMSLKDISESCFDSAADSYEKKRQIAASYMLIQVGICLFEKTTGGKYLVRPFNFFAFPSSDYTFRKLVRPITLETEAVAFLRRNNLDFQKWIYEGVGYCNEEEEQLYREHVEEQYAPKRQDIVLRDGDKETAEKILQYIKNWLSTDQGAKELMLPQTDSRPIRKFVENQLSVIAPSHESTFRGRKWLIIPKVAADVERMKEERMLNFCGVREIFKLLVKYRKPIVGHNMLMDLFFLISGVDRPIPNSIANFQEYMQETFPSVWDTKVLTAADPALESKLRFSGLQYLFEYFSENPIMSAEQKDGSSSANESSPQDSAPHEGALDCMQFPLGFEKYEVVLKKHRVPSPNKQSLAHEAAYDAMCTGFVFLQLRAGMNDETFRSCHNHVAIFKNYNALNTSVAGPLSKKICRGPVLRLTYSTSHEVQVEASLAPLKGRVEWRENGTAAAVLHSTLSADEGLQHYATRDDDIKAELYL
ncbi:ribonuclease [Perkinsela sp. CCAP 1560/4]|nr:ribonuclease [Perkinsela sp. CCAP 1560/4]|eukprot:KNH07043.1 ribonuclease [Perkinsela sp. CCAP 1560/4]